MRRTLGPITITILLAGFLVVVLATLGVTGDQFVNQVPGRLSQTSPLATNLVALAWVTVALSALYLAIRMNDHHHHHSVDDYLKHTHDYAESVRLQQKKRGRRKPRVVHYGERVNR